MATTQSFDELSDRPASDARSPIPAQPVSVGSAKPPKSTVHAVPAQIMACPTGAFQYLRTTKTLEWSDTVYELHGYSRGDVVPTPELALTHITKAERDHVRGMWQSAIQGRGPVAAYHSVIDADGRRHQVLTVAQQIFDTDMHVDPDADTGSGTASGSGADGVVGIKGYVSDLTAPLHEDVACRANDAIARAARNRGEIEQAKGILMALRGVSAELAFLAISRYSQHHNHKVRDLAHIVVQACASTTALHTIIDAICPTTVGSEREHRFDTGPR